MKLEGVHHITAITGDAQKNVDFYVGRPGPPPGEEDGQPGRPDRLPPLLRRREGRCGIGPDLLRVPGRPRVAPATGMIWGIRWRVGSTEALDFWAERLEQHGVDAELDGDTLRFADPEGLGHALRVRRDHGRAADRGAPGDPPGGRAAGLRRRDRLLEQSRGQPPAARAGARVRAGRPSESGQSGWEARGESRGGLWGYSEPPAERGLQGAGSVHHIAWASQIDEHEAWRDRVIAAGARPTPVIDRFYFRSIYFREPSGVLFEIATLGPGLHSGRAARDPRREALAAPRLRAPPGAGRAGSAADQQPACHRLSPPDDRPGQVVELVHLDREPAGEPDGALILLHGRGGRRARPLPNARRARPGAQAVRDDPGCAAHERAARRAPLVRDQGGRASRRGDLRGHA